MSDLARRLSGLSPERRALLDSLLQDKGVALPRSVILPRRDAGAAGPLSFSQQRLWFLDQLEPGNTAYNIASGIRLNGPLDVGALARAFAEVVRRHATLRTVFALGSQEPRQVIRPPAPLPLPLIDLGSLDAVARDQESLRLADAEAKRPFDLAQGPLLRIQLLRLAEQEHISLLTMHHIVSDGWSVSILIREVGALYQAFHSHLPSPLPELPLQYVDFADWQRRWLSGDTLTAELSYWRRQLAGAPPVLDLPADRLPPAVRSTRGGVKPFGLTREVSVLLLALGRAAEATPFMVLLAAFVSLIHGYAGVEDVSVGTAIAGRNRSEIEGLIGFFVNTLVLRVDLAGDPEFRMLLDRTREVVLAAQTHQDLPFEKLVEELNPERSLGHSPLFQVMFVLQNTPRAAIDLSGLAVRPIESAETTAKFDLTLAITEEEIGFHGGLDYRLDLFEATTIARMLGHFQALLAGIAADPGRRLSALPLLNGAELSQLLIEWNDSTAAGPPRCFHDLFAEQADLHPDAPAVAFEGETLSYRDLEHRANRVAHWLRRAGVGAESRVAICVERSLEMVVGLLGVLKSGGAYVPLDPEFPPDRLGFMIEDSGARVLLTQRRLLAGLEVDALRALCLDDESALAAERADRPASGVTPDSLVYVIYTSGSTGRPKGVAVEHRQLWNYLHGVLARLALPSGSTYATVSTIAADLGNTVVFTALATGGLLHVISRSRLAEPEGMAEYFAAHPIDCLKIVPSHLAALLAARQPSAVLPRRVLVLGGEACPWDLVAGLRGLSRGCRILNHYGPTETTVGVLTLDSGTLQVGGREAIVPLGRPLANTQIYVLERGLVPVPLGARGELVIGGSGLSRGYLGRPELTAERFVPDPFGESGGRLYRTGDLARFRADGALEFLGRLDHQVKVRGFRIELGEIESALLRHPRVRSAVVLVREDAPGDRRLVGYVAVGEGEALGEEELRRHLGVSLPEYMVPASLVVLASLPLTPNGKVDRRALPSPERRVSEAEVAAPRTLTEEVLAGIWEEVLGLDRVGIHTSFFALGGHSLLATQVISRAERALGRGLTLRALFESPTIYELAARLDRERRTGAEPPPLLRVEGSEGAPLSFAQQRLWFLDQLEPGSTAYNIPLALRLEGRLRVGVLSAALEEVVRRHETLRSTFPQVSGEPVLRVDPPGVWSLPWIDLSGLGGGLREGELSRLVEQESRRAFDLARGPLLRASLVRLGVEDHAVLASLHHIVSDGWSGGVLVREMTALYGAFAAGEPSPLAELPVQYKDYASWQRRWLQGEVLAGELEVWRQRLSGAPAVLELPTDRPRPLVPSQRGAAVSFVLEGEVSSSLSALGRREGATLFMVLLAALQGLLSRFTGVEDLSVGTPVAGRTRVEVEGLIGFFVNTLVLRTDVSGELSLRELLSRAREVSLEAHAHQEVPFEKLVEELQPERSLSYSPLFQVLLVVQNAPMGELALPELSVRRLGVESGGAKFDLSFSFGETRGGVSGSVEYSMDLFDRSTALRLAGSLMALLAGFAANPGQRLSEIELAGEGERHQLLHEWNDTRRAVSGECLHELIAAQAARTPEAVALIWGEQRWSYRELLIRSARVSHHLRSLGIGPETRVGICLQRSPALVTAVLGVLGAGGAYVPLDPSYPAERLAFMIEDSQARLVMSERSLEGLLAPATPVVWIEDVPEGEGWGFVQGRMAADHLAYLIYTSGSTGRPKGAAIAHRSAVALLRWAWEEFSLAELGGVLASTSISFDLSVFELFVPLSRGGTVILVEDALSLATAPSAGEVTLLNTVPSAAGALLELGAMPSSVRVVNLGGEALRNALVQQLYAQTGVARVLNLYGPSEDTTYSTWSVAGRGEVGEPPIGRPLANTQIYVVDRGLVRMPLGARGELVIGGAGLSRGYLGRPELTAERFVPDPFGESGGRLYRTGDLARFRADGALEFLGRLDHQVKVRGFRIELGEIESALLRHPRVRSAVVLVREDLPGDRRLVGYAAVGEGEAPGEEELRRHLGLSLPEYMVPASLVVLASLPLTPNRKVDRRALPSPERRVSEAEVAAPRTLTEEVLAGIWKEVLGVDRVGIHSSFFALGGHSLLVVRLRARIARDFDRELPLAALFQQPTIAQIAALLQGSPVPASHRLSPVPRGLPLPLSFAQERLWFLYLLAPESPVYNMTTALRLAGRLDAGVLAAALSEVCRRHEALRTSFRTTAVGAIQEIHPWRPLRLSVADLSSLPAASRDAEARRIAARLAEQPFDLRRETLLLRTLLICLADESHVVLWSTHHIVSDGWSLGSVLLPEVVTLYAAFLEGRPSPLPALPVQYADYAVWQREWLRGAVQESQLAYWRERLAGLSPIELHADRPRPAVPSGRGGAEVWHLPAEPAERLRRFAGAGDSTLFMALFAGFAALLHRETGALGVPVGIPVAGRSRIELEGLIGFFVNTLVLHGDLAGDPAFAELLDRARGTVLGALDHQDLPFENLVEGLDLPRNPYRPPLLRVVFQLQSAPPARPATETGGLIATPFEGGVETAKFDLVVDLFEGPEGISGSFGYDADLFDPPTVARLAGHYSALLDAWIAAPGRRLSDLPLLTAVERHQLLLEWNPSPPLPEGEPACLHHLFESRVDRAPEARAVTVGKEGLSYGDLDRRANRLARHLRANGVQPGDRVALRLERSMEMVVVILAVLKAGAAYVPLDPDHPAERIAYALENSGASLLVAEEELAAAVPVPTLRLDVAQGEIERQSGERIAISLPADFPAYVIYTSGSTGRPKGVVVTHANVHRLFTTTAPWFGFGPDDVWTLFHSYTFDFSVWELWGALLHGGRLVVVPYWESRSPADFYRLLHDERVTVLNQTPSAFRQLLWAAEAVSGGGAPDLALRWVVFGGEALEPASLAPWFARHGDERPRLVNMYGITETTVHVTFRPMRVADLGGGRPIGRPLPDLAVHVFDADLQLRPIGVPGEIHVGGPGLAQGYLGKPELTAERFVPDPFAVSPGARLYRSGDLARRLPDGDLEYLGRGDQQVKIRGFRIELGEIEAALALQPGVREVAVLAREDEPGGERRLVAYLGGEAGDPAALRASLAERLPGYMLPAAFVFLAALPLTGNGKVDRRALLAVAAPAPAAPLHTPPRTPLERFLAQQFREVLGLADREIGIHDDFFALGGTSITGAIAIHRLQEALRGSLQIMAIFDHPTVASLAAFVRERHAGAAERIGSAGSAGALASGGSALVPDEPFDPPARGVLVPLQEGSPGGRPLFCVHPVGGEVVAYHELARRLGADLPVYGLQSPDPPLEDITEMAQRYVIAIRAVQPAGPYRLAGWSMGGIVAYEMARQLAARGEPVDVLALIDTLPPAAWTGAEPGETALVGLFAADLARLHGVEVPPVDLSPLAADAALAAVLDLGRQAGLLPPDVRPAELRRLFARFRANRRSLGRYRTSGYAGPVSLFRAAGRMEEAGEEDSVRGWSELLNGGLQIVDLPGDHYSILREGVETLAAQLRALLG